MCEVKGKIEEQREENKRSLETQNQFIVELQEKLQTATEESDTAEENLSKCQLITTNVLEGIQSVFRFIQCDPTPIMQLLGTFIKNSWLKYNYRSHRNKLIISGPNATVTTQNCMLYLDIIERRVMNIIELVWYLSYSKIAARAAKLFPGQVSILREPVMRSIKPTVPKVLTSDKVVPTQPCPL